MSTKILNGFSLDLQPHEWMGWVQSLRSKLEPLADRVLSEALERFMVRDLDHRFLVAADRMRADPGAGASVSDRAWSELADRLKDAQKGRFDPLDVETSLVLYYDAQDGRSYLQTFGSCEALKKVIEKAPEVQSFCYWDHTDPEEGVSDEAWSARQAVWERLIGKTPALSGLTALLVPEGATLIPSLSCVMAAPAVDLSRADRAKGWAEEAYAQSHPEVFAPEDGSPLTIGHYASVRRRADVRAAIEATARDLEALLPFSWSREAFAQSDVQIDRWCAETLLTQRTTPSPDRGIKPRL